MQIARVFFDVHMGKNFKGLLKICHKNKYLPEALRESYVVFMNSKHTKFKMLIGNKYLVYHDNGDRKIPLEAIQHLPSAITGDRFTFDKALEITMREKLGLK